jgi:2-keto-4-pentenoate hydratase
MDAKRITGFAGQLFEAERSRRAAAPLTVRDESITADEAYKIQLVNVKRALAAGRRISGKKIGLTSPGIQKQFGVHEPDYGHLFADMECPTGEVPAAALLQPRIEGELAFVLKESLTGGKVTARDVRRAADYVTAAFEIVDSRIQDWKIKLQDTVADNASSGRYVLGSVRLKVTEVKLSEVTMKLYKNGELIGEGSGSAVLGDPAKAVAWLANRLWAYGVSLNAGEIILSGAFFAAAPALRGDIFTAEYSSFGRVEARFV